MALHFVTACSNCVSRTEYSFLSQQPAARTAKFLSPNRIFELVWDSESDEAGAPSDVISEDEGGFEDEPGVSHLQPDRPTSRGQASSSSFSTSASDEEGVFWSGPSQQVQTPFHFKWTRPSGPHRSSTLLKGDARVKRDSETPHINDGSVHLEFRVVFCRKYYTAGG